jgi:hypothetical protein
MFSAVRSCQIPFDTTATGPVDALGPCVITPETDCLARTNLTTWEKVFGPCQVQAIPGVKNEWLAFGFGGLLLLTILK